MNYVDDVKMVLTGYRDKMETSNLKVSSIKTDLIFGNLEEIWEFHAAILLPHLESCHLNPTLIAKTFLEYSQQLTRMYCRSDNTDNIPTSHKNWTRIFLGGC